MPSVIVVGLLVTARLVPLAVMLPRVFSSAAPRRWSLGFAIVLGVAIAPQFSLPATLNLAEGWELSMAVLRELIHGFALSLGFSVLLSGLYLTGRIVGQLSGVSLPDVADPQTSGLGDNVVHRYFSWLALAVLLVSGGHRQLLQALLDSFTWVPPGSSWPIVQPVPMAAQLLTESFQSGLRAAAPVAFCLIVSTFVVAVLARTMPSLGAFGLSISVNMVVLLLVTCLSIEAIATVYQQSWSGGIDRMLTAWLGQGGINP